MGEQPRRPPVFSQHHRGPRRRHPPRPPGGRPADRDRWVRLLRRGDPAPRGFRLRVRAGDQDASQRPRRPRRATGEDRDRDAAEGRVGAVRRFRAPEHVVRRAPEPHHRQGSAYLRRCSPCHARGEDQLRGHIETPALLLQLRPATPCAEIRARDQDAGDAGRRAEHAPDLERHLHGAPTLSTSESRSRSGFSWRLCCNFRAATSGWTVLASTLPGPP